MGRPWGAGAYFEFRYGTDDDGDLVVTEAAEVTIEGVVHPKARRKAAAAGRREGLGAKTQPPAGDAPPAVDPPAPSSEGPSPSAVLLDADLLELGEDPASTT